MTVVDQGSRAAALLLQEGWSSNDALRMEAVVRSNLATAQQLKAGNLMAYLTADTTGWSDDVHAAVRGYLGLPSEGQEGS